LSPPTISVHDVADRVGLWTPQRISLHQRATHSSSYLACSPVFGIEPLDFHPANECSGTDAGRASRLLDISLGQKRSDRLFLLALQFSPWPAIRCHLVPTASARRPNRLSFARSDFPQNVLACVPVFQFDRSGPVIQHAALLEVRVPQDARQRRRRSRRRSVGLPLLRRIRERLRANARGAAASVGVSAFDRMG